jgi:soluble P-type ATPase
VWPPLGTWANDRLLLKAVKEAGGLAIVVDDGDGCAIEALVNAHVFIAAAANAMDLLIDTNFVKATLRF